MSLSLCTDISAADWLVGQDLPWYQLTASGPIGFPAYARLRFIPDPTYEGQRENVAESPADTLTPADDGYLTENDQFKIVAEILAPYTNTPDDCFFCPTPIPLTTASSAYGTVGAGTSPVTTARW